MQFKIQPFKHQLEALAISTKVRDLALLWEMGTGKTACIVNILRQHYFTLGMQRTLILAPVVVLENWRDEILMHSHLKIQQIVVLSSNGRKRIQLIQKEVVGKEVICITNYESLQNDEIKDLILEWAPRILVCDESHYIKNHKSKRAKVVAEVADKTLHNYILTGTPILNNPMDIYMQYRVLDRGQSLGQNFFAFRGHFFFDANEGWSSSAHHFPKWQIRPDRIEELNDIIYRKAIRKTKKECLDLPELITITRYVELSPEQKRLYEEMKRDFVAWLKVQTVDGEKEVASVATIALTKALRLQQIVSGLFKGEDASIMLADIPRAEELQALLEDLTPNHKVIVWCAFEHEISICENVCKKIGVKYELLTGAQNQQGKDTAIRSFRGNSDIRTIIANRRAGGTGVNLTEASYSIVFGRTFSLGDELQSEARNYRAGSERHASITKINLCAKGTIDELVLKRLQEKQDLSNRIIDFVKEVLDE